MNESADPKVWWDMIGKMPQRFLFAQGKGLVISSWHSTSRRPDRLQKIRKNWLRDTACRQQVNISEKQAFWNGKLEGKGIWGGVRGARVLTKPQSLSELTTACALGAHRNTSAPHQLQPLSCRLQERLCQLKTHPWVSNAIMVLHKPQGSIPSSPGGTLGVALCITSF